MLKRYSQALHYGHTYKPISILNHLIVLRVQIRCVQCVLAAKHKPARADNPNVGLQGFHVSRYDLALTPLVESFIGLRAFYSKHIDLRCLSTPAGHESLLNQTQVEVVVLLTLCMGPAGTTSAESLTCRKTWQKTKSTKLQQDWAG